MRCNCEECRGTGQIECPECGGSGNYQGGIENMSLQKNMHNYDELLELQKDARRVIRQAETLKKLNPARAGSYTDQLIGTLGAINALADKAAVMK